MLDRAKDFYHRHEPGCTAGLFVFGFLFDTLAVGRIDAVHNIIHQASYLSLCAFFAGLELREVYGSFSPPERLKAAWRYQAGATHFMLGTLLNIYTLFYFKSASFAVSSLFLLFLCALLYVNEAKPFGGSGVTLRLALFSLCLVSYFTYLVPVLVGSIGAWPFIGSLAAAAAALTPLAWWLLRKLPDRPHAVLRHVVLPFAAVELGFAILYFSKVIPPVPLSLSAIGIYHDVRQEGDRYALTSTRSRWKFWQRGDQTFAARPGDRVFAFISVFSPTRFKERLQVRWLYKDPALGWQDADAIPMAITGGRDGGFRGYTVKSRYKPGRWRVRIETSDGRELGRIGLTIVEEAAQTPRATKTTWR